MSQNNCATRYTLINFFFLYCFSGIISGNTKCGNFGEVIFSNKMSKYVTWIKDNIKVISKNRNGTFKMFEIVNEYLLAIHCIL